MNLQRKCNKCVHQNVFLYFFRQLHLLARPLCQSADKHFAGKRKDVSDSCRTDKSRFNHCKCLQNKQLQMLTDDKSSLEEAAQPCGRAPPIGQRWDSSGALGGSHVTGGLERPGEVKWRSKRGRGDLHLIHYDIQSARQRNVLNGNLDGCNYSPTTQSSFASLRLYHI